MSYSGRSGTATHEECAHFKDGFCMLNGVPVDPHQPACPNFTPMDKKGTFQFRKTLPSKQKIPQKVHPAYSPPFELSIHPHSSYAQNPPYPPLPYDLQGYRTSQKRSVIPRQNINTAYSQYSGLGGGGSGRGRRGGGRNGNRGRGRRKGRGFAGPGGSCVCPNCNYTVPHRPGTPCLQQKCPQCGTSMVRRS